MTKLKNCAVIVSDFPDDAVEENNDIVVWPGRGIAEAFCEILRELGYEASAPEPEDEHGWTFVAKADDGRRTWFQVTMIKDCLLITEDIGRSGNLLSLMFGRKSSPSTYTDMLARFGAALEADSRFREARWMAQDDIDI